MFYLVLEARSLFVAISKLGFLGQVLLKVVSAGLLSFSVDITDYSLAKLSVEQDGMELI